MPAKLSTTLISEPYLIEREARRTADHLIHIVRRYVPEAVMGDARDAIALALIDSGMRLVSRAERREMELLKEALGGSGLAPTQPNEKIMTGLIERLEKATGPDRELDRLICESRPERRGTYYGEPTGDYYGLDGAQLPECAPTYTASIDAALTLVPEGHQWLMRTGQRADGDDRPYAHVWPNGKRCGDDAAHSSPIIALCIAGLKARGIT